MGDPSVDPDLIESDRLLRDRIGPLAIRAHFGGLFDIGVLERLNAHETDSDLEPSAALLAMRIRSLLGLHQVTVMK
jgi:hypothetical protein